MEYFAAREPGMEDAGGKSQIERIVRKEVKERCQNLVSYKRVTKLTVCHGELEKTTTKKVKRYLYTGRAASQDLNDSRG